MRNLLFIAVLSLGCGDALAPGPDASFEDTGVADMGVVLEATVHADSATRPDAFHGLGAPCSSTSDCALKFDPVCKASRCTFSCEEVIAGRPSIHPLRKVYCSSRGGECFRDGNTIAYCKPREP